MAKRKWTVLGLISRPLKAYREACKILKSIDLVPVVTIEPRRGSEVKQDGFIMLGSIALPADVWKRIQPCLIKLDYKYVDSKKQYFIPKDQSVYTEEITKDEMTALYVARRFEDAA